MGEPDAVGRALSPRSRKGGWQAEGASIVHLEGEALLAREEGRHASPTGPDPDGDGFFPKGDPTFTIISTLVVALGPLSFGYTLGYTSPVLPDIASELDLTVSQASFFGALVNIGCMAGAAASGTLADSLGRKGALAAAAIPDILGWLVIATARDPLTLYVGRFLAGFGTGVVSFVVPVYIAEVAPSHLRGGLGAFNQLAITIGIMLVYAMGMSVTWRQLAFMGALPMALLLGGLVVVPETPRWLAKQGLNSRLAAALQRLRGKDSDIRSEMEEIQEAALQSSSLPRATLRDLFKQDLMRPLLAGVGLMVLQQFSGVNAVMFYSGNIFRAAGVGSANAAAFAVGLLQVCFTALAAWLMDKAGRRILLMLSAAVMAVSSATLSLSFILKPTGADGGTTISSILAICSLLFYIVGFSLGIGAIPWIIMSEVFPVHVRGTAGSVATLVNWSCSFLVTQTFQWLLDWSPPGAFLLYAAECAATIAFVLLYVPETRGKTLEQIEAEFKRS